MEINEKTTYEEALQRLKKIIEKLEAKEVEIDNLSDTVIEAKKLVDFCRNKLNLTEDNIKRIIEQGKEEE